MKGQTSHCCNAEAKKRPSHIGGDYPFCEYLCTLCNRPCGLNKTCCERAEKAERTRIIEAVKQRLSHTSYKALTEEEVISIIEDIK